MTSVCREAFPSRCAYIALLRRTEFFHNKHPWYSSRWTLHTHPELTCTLQFLFFQAALGAQNPFQTFHQTGFPTLSLDCILRLCTLPSIQFLQNTKYFLLECMSAPEIWIYRYSKYVYSIHITTSTTNYISKKISNLYLFKPQSPSRQHKNRILNSISLRIL